MNITLWILQGLLALHTLTGAIWKFSNSEQTVPSLSAIPNSAWLGLSVMELACVVGLLVPLLSENLGTLPPIAAVVIAGEMLLFCAIHLASGEGNHGQLVYWLVTAALCAFIAYGRFVLKPHQ